MKFYKLYHDSSLYYVNFFCPTGTGDVDEIAHFIEHLLFYGHKSIAGEKIYCLFEEWGTFLNAYTTSTYICLFYCIDKEYLEQSLDIIIQCILEFSVDEKDFLQEKELIKKEIWQLYSSRKYILFNNGINLAQRKLAQIDEISHEELMAYYERNYSYEKWRCLVLGPEFVETSINELKISTGFIRCKKVNLSKGDTPKAKMSSGKTIRIELSAIATPYIYNNLFLDAINFMFGKGYKCCLDQTFLVQNNADRIITIGEGYRQHIRYIIGVYGDFDGTISRIKDVLNDRLREFILLPSFHSREIHLLSNKLFKTVEDGARLSNYLISKAVNFNNFNSVYSEITYLNSQSFYWSLINLLKSLDITID